MGKIRALSKPRNLFHALLSRKWHEVIDGDRTLLYDGDELVIERREFPADGGWGELRELKFRTGECFRRTEPNRPWTCVGGTNFGQRIDHIELDMEERPQESPLFGLLCVNVVGSTYCYFNI